jgi:hypothetical protein
MEPSTTRWGSADEAAAAQTAATEAFEGARSRGLDTNGLPAGKWCLTAEESKAINGKGQQNDAFNGKISFASTCTSAVCYSEE